MSIKPVLFKNSITPATDNHTLMVRIVGGTHGADELWRTGIVVVGLSDSAAGAMCNRRAAAGAALASLGPDPGARLVSPLTPYRRRVVDVSLLSGLRTQEVQ